MYYESPMNGSDWGWGLFMMLIWLLFFVISAVVSVRLLKGHEDGTTGKVDPLDIAKEHYAKGDITKDGFEQLKKIKIAE